MYNRLLEWKRNEASRCALLIEGARRVGKSYIVEEFAKSEYRHHLIIDFANTTKAIKDLFEEKLGNLDEFFMMLEVRTGVELIRGETLIVFKVRAIWRAIPRELSLLDKRFSPGAVDRGVRMRELDAPFDWLASSMTVNLAYEDGRNRIEIEFLLSKSQTTSRHNVIPIEVKSNNDYTTVSLERFKEKFPGYCTERYVLYPGNADFIGDIKYLPLYMAPQLVHRRGSV